MVINNRTRILTTLSSSTMHSTRACWYKHHISHSMPENKTYVRNGHFTNEMYQDSQNRRHQHHIAPFWPSHTDHDQ